MKIKMGLGLVPSPHFLHNFCGKIISFLIPSLLPIFIVGGFFPRYFEIPIWYFMPRP